MQKSFLKSLVIAAIAALAAIVAPTALAQVTTSGMTGVVRGTDGNPVSGATVVAVHTPTNASFTAKANADGRYYFRGLPVGGPYTVTASADSYSNQVANDITTELGADIPVNFTMRSDVVKLEKFVVSAEKNAFDPSVQGTTFVYTRDQIEAKPTTQRSFADLAAASPQVTLRSLSGDREEAQITALGQNNRYNSVMIDGNRLNDQFGLNATGLASFFNPISLDTIEQYNILTSTTDLRYSGFTGATINFVTRSGTNKFHGAATYIFTGDHLGGYQFQGPDARTLVQSGTKVVPHLERTTKTLTLSGPIWKDHIFFLLNWEKLERIGAPNSAGMPGVNSADLATITGRIAQISKVNYGALGGNANSIANEEKKLLKLDWQINSQHRLTARYSTAEGQVPQFGSFTTTSYGSGLNNNSAFSNLVGGPATAFDSHFYAQQRKEKSLSAQLVSNWTPDLTTTLKWSEVKQDQYTPTAVVGPEIDIFNVRGVNQAGASVTNGVVVLGTERFRHGNQINVDTKNYAASADYRRGNVTYTAGFDLEDNAYYNLFRQYSFGVFNYASPADFAADLPRFFQRNYTDVALKGSYADISQYTQTGLFAEAKWDVNNRLNVAGGVRYDWSTSTTRPVFNQQFFTDTGMRNDGTVDGATDISPRFGFNYAIDEERKTQVRGSLGYYVGRAPWVFFSNSYGQTGLGTFTSSALPAGGLSGYLANNFDPAAPMGTATQTGTPRAEMDIVDPGIHMPSLWRLNLSVDHKLDFLSSKLTLEYSHSINDHTFFISNDDLKVKGIAADGRVYFYGNPGSGATPAQAVNAKYPNYTAIYHVRNVKAGQATYVTLTWDRQLKNNWGFNLAYTRGKSTEAQASGQTTASGYWQRNAVFNQSAVETGTADFEVRDRLQASFTRQFEVIRNWKTKVSLYYEGRTGTPFSYAYSSDLNQDGMAGNDLYSVPSGPSDSRFDFTGLSQTQMDAMFAYLQANGLNKYAGSYAPKNAFYQPWQNRLDLRVRQEIPLHWDAKLELFADFTNFGNFISKSLFNYVERAPSTVNDVFDRVLLGSASIDNTTGKIKVSSWSAPTGFLIDNVMSRWRLQVGATLKF